MNTNSLTEIQYPISKTFKVKAIDVTATIKHKGDIVHYFIDAHPAHAHSIYAYMHEEGLLTLQFLQQ